MDECVELTQQAFEMQDALDIHGFLEEWIKKHFPKDYFVDQS